MGQGLEAVKRLARRAELAQLEVAADAEEADL